MNKKYQVFVSSTFEDLKDERNQVIKSVLEMGHIPVGMEMFSAADEEQWKIIQRQIDESDYYVVIVANEYGSVTSEGISYTEKEYNYAISIGLPVLGFVLDNAAPWPSERNATSTRAVKALNQFKSKLKGRLVNFWSSKDDLHAKVSVSLMKTINTNPRTGWVKASDSVGPEVMKELARLSSENALLRSEISKVKAVVEDKIDAVREAFAILNRNDFQVRVRTSGKWGDADQYSCSLLDVFEWAAPNLINENTALGMSQNIALGLSGKTDYHKNWPIGKNVMSNWTADFAALDLIEPSRKKHSVHDKDAYWSLTKLGKQVLKQSRRIRLEQGLASDEQDGGL